METIKKYANRKLYSTTLSKYVGLPYILDLVKTGQSFQVVDAKDKTDITTRIIQQSLTTVELDKTTLTTLIKSL